MPRKRKQKVFEQLRFTFDGRTYEPDLDQMRLAAQAVAVWKLMRDGKWRTLNDIEWLTGAPPQSASARLRDFRKARWGYQTVERRRRSGGLFEYRLVLRKEVEANAVRAANE